MTLEITAFIVLALVCFFVIDDLVIDFAAIFWRLGPRELKSEDLAELATLPQKKIAIMVANWHEAEIIGRMVRSNVHRVDYSEYHFFLGVYPNDLATQQAAEQVASDVSNAHVVINPLPGPTSKGQMLNEVAREILNQEKRLGVKFDIFLMQDSEDVLHPLGLQVINREIEHCDFLQTPIFSMDRPIGQLVGSTYIDEFSELHTKDLLVRQKMGAAIPSAGVGTALGRSLMLRLMENPTRSFLREDSLTEDYVLGMSAGLFGFKSAFCCYYRELPNGTRDLIATRELFPAKFMASVRQRSRWIVGIVFQGAKMIPWHGSIANRYFIYRDRRGPINNIVAMCCTILTVYLLYCVYYAHSAPAFVSEAWFLFGSVIATIGAIVRFIQRCIAVGRANAARSILLLIVRWPLANLINAVATLRGLRDVQRSKWSGEPIKWVKTTHELPPMDHL